MQDLFKLILGVLAFFKSRARLEAEILSLRQQINVLRRRAPQRPHLNNTDRFCLCGFITGSPPSWARLRLSGRRRSFAGTALGFERIGAGDNAGIVQIDFWMTFSEGTRIQSRRFISFPYGQLPEGRMLSYHPLSKHLPRILVNSCPLLDAEPIP